VTEEQRSQTAFSAKTLRAAGPLPGASVGSAVTARCGDAPASPPWPRPKSLAAAPLRIFRQALRFKVLRSREFGDIGIIECAPGNRAWRPVAAEGYLVIHCLMVNSKHKGQGVGHSVVEKLSQRRKEEQVPGDRSCDQFRQFHGRK